MFLTPKEIADLTKRVRPSAQARVMDALDIPYRLHPDGTLIVFRKDVTDETPQERQASPKVRVPETRRLLAGQVG